MTQQASAIRDKTVTCAHCNLPVPAESAGGPNYCGRGCAAAQALISGLGLARYYERRVLDPALRPPRPDPDEQGYDYAAYASPGKEGTCTLYLMVDGLHCGACVWLIESVLGREEGVIWARVNLSTRRLTVTWREGEADPNALAGKVAALGYRVAPFDPVRLGRETGAEEKELLRSVAVAGFAAANVMLLSVSVWAGYFQDMGPATRGLLHWISAIIAIPAIAYAGRPFFRSAVAALVAFRANMDVPISLAVLLAVAMSVFEASKGGTHVYFDSAVMLLFFLLVGRYLDRRARGRARSAAENLLALGATPITTIDENGARRTLPPEQVSPGMIVLVAPGERIGVDGKVVEGQSQVDTGLIDGESVPKQIGPGDRVFAGTLNLGTALRVAVTAAGTDTLLAEIARLMEAAEAGRTGYVALADRVARLYAPVVHILAFATFAGWIAFTAASWQVAMLNAIAVLIITCPCALAIAIPAVQVIASGRLFRHGILLKSATALERLAQVDTVAFDKTGTLTVGRVELVVSEEGPDRDALALAASLCAASRHPLARAICRAAPLASVARGVQEIPGAGLLLAGEEGDVRLGSRSFCDIRDDDREDCPELWLVRPHNAPVRFVFRDRLRSDGAETVASLRRAGYAVALVSGDRRAPVVQAANELGIDEWQAECRPDGKVEWLRDKTAAGQRVVMVGDGLNDAPALAAASVSMSPASAADISQTVADVVFQGERLAPVAETLAVARRAHRLVRQNLALAIGYNAVTIPLAVFGWVTPLVAAVAMSASSLLVVGNALRLSGKDRP